MSENNIAELNAIAVVTESGFLIPKFVAQFKQYARKSTESTLEMARIITEAKAQLSKNDFRIFCTEIGFDKGDAFISKMKKIGGRYELFSQHLDKLPVAMSTLYGLASISVEDFETGIGLGTIHAQMTARELEQIAPNAQSNQTASAEDQQTGAISDSSTEVDEVPKPAYGFRLKFNSVITSDKHDELQKELLALSQKYGFELEIA